MKRIVAMAGITISLAVAAAGPAQAAAADSTTCSVLKQLGLLRIGCE